MMKSFKVMLVPNNNQRTRLFQFAGTARFAFNWALQKEREAYESGEKFISNNDLRKEFTVLRNSAEYRWLKTISNNVTKQAIKDCVDAYTKFFKKQSSRPKFKSKRRGDFSFYQDTDKIRITATHVKLEAVATSKKRNKQSLNWFRLAECGRIPVSVKYQQPRITFDGLNWWLSVAVEFVDPKPAENCSEPIGIDLGIKTLATCSDGTIYPNINRTKTVRRLKKKQRRLQRSISRRKLRENAQHYKEREKTFTDSSPIGFQIIRNAKCAMRNDYGFNCALRITNYALSFGDRFYPSSKTCVACGHVKKNLRLSERIYHCENCGNEIDRDLQAAINLKRYAS